MAETAANFTRTYQNKPTIFEILAQKSLNDTLYPALQKVALFLSTTFPRKCGFLNLYYDETFAAVQGLLQIYYIKTYDSSFSENFYGIKRVLPDGSKLDKRTQDLCLIWLIVGPYLKRKFEDRLQMYKLQQAEDSLQDDFSSKTKKILINSYTAFEVVWGLLSVHNYLRYMGGKTEYQTLFLRLLNVKLEYSNEEPTVGFWSALFSGELTLSKLNLGLVRGAVSTIFETTALFLQFLNTWNGEKANYSITDLPKVEAPSISGEGLPKGICPICDKKWINPTVVPISGVIYCFRCILQSLNKTPQCPVTKLPSMPFDIIRLFVSD